MTMLAVPEHYILLDITINMDIQSQPGPETALIEESRMGAAFGMKYLSNMGKQARCASFGQAKLLSLRNTKSKPSTAVMTELKSLGLLRYRGRRGTGNLDSKLLKKIEVVKSRCIELNLGNRQNDRRNLINIPRCNTNINATTTEFAVPKCLFTNICGLKKTKNRVRTPVALEADLRNQRHRCVCCIRNASFHRNARCARKHPKLHFIQT